MYLLARSFRPPLPVERDEVFLYGLNTPNPVSYDDAFLADAFAASAGETLTDALTVFFLFLFIFPFTDMNNIYHSTASNGKYSTCILGRNME